MSRIQEILKKAERDGTVHRTRGLGPDATPMREPGVVNPPTQDARPRWSEPVGMAATATMERGPIAPPIAMPPIPEPPAFEPAVWSPAEDGPDTDARPGTGGLDERLVAALAPQSLAAEQYRLLRTRITQSENGHSFRSIVVTSPGKGDGKSLTAANLALTMAQEFQQRVLLVDADLRRPSIHELFGVPDAPGLTAVLMGGAALDDALIPLPNHRLTLMPCGSIPSHPAELLGSSGMRRLLDSLRARFDRVILDMPPVEPLADVSIVSGLVDGLLLVVRAGLTPRPAIERALSGLEPDKVLGLVFNDIGAESTSREYGYIGG